ncbi:MAG TPA: LPS export ABC transporter periplasmic protein LptC, partial [Bryobacteraceae bacterium]|nr:LPS export ABC transporter periplasmic protein LptC [Bryobacteraceae bacterium]
MRRTRRILLLLITAILVTIGVIYSVQRETQARNAPPPPPVLPKEVNARAKEWSFEKTDGNRPIVRIFAQNFRQVAEGARFELEHVRLHIFHKDGKVYDEVKSARADWNVDSEQLFSEGAVEISMGVQADTGKPSGNLVKIQSSGVSFDGKTGTASTERAAAFQFSRGEGTCTGARYDPSKRELQMHADVKLAWWGEKPDQNRIEVETGSLIYNEVQSQAVLTPWTKFRRGTLSMESENSLVTVADGSLKQVEAVKARGTDVQPKRQVQFAADHMLLNFSAAGLIEKLIGTESARFHSLSPTTHTNISSRRVDLDFVAIAEESVLQKVVTNGSTTVESKPAVKSPTMPETRIIKSEVVLLHMRPGGEDIDKVETQSPGSIEFVPNRPGQRKRFVTGDYLLA